MTCIIGFINSDKKTMKLVSDSRSSYGNGFYLNKNGFREKVFTKGKFVIGCSGSSLLNQIVQFNFELPVHESGIDTKVYLVKTFIPELRKSISINGGDKKDSKGRMEGRIILGYEGKIFTLDSNYCIIEQDNKFTCIGSGAQIAYGSLATPSKLSDMDKAKQAIDISSKFLNNIGGDLSEIELNY